jgi:cell division protease FtsH
VENCYEKAKAILTEHLDILHAIAQELLEKETLQKSDIDRIIESIKPGLISATPKE